MTVRNCAYINEKFLDNFDDSSDESKKLDEIDILYLEALLRQHSTALWYSKTKATKINKVLKKLIVNTLASKRNNREINANKLSTSQETPV